MLETSEERVKLLRAGISSKTIEELYIEKNNFKIGVFPPVFELVEIDTQENENKSICIEASEEYCCA